MLKEKRHKDKDKARQKSDTSLTALFFQNNMQTAKAAKLDENQAISRPIRPGGAKDAAAVPEMKIRQKNKKALDFVRAEILYCISRWAR
jgi:hypothetical protein